ncbi:MAG: J domain-containing protein [Sulfurimonas sp.]|jgi:hypothetical protein|nr:J domain-containing protein [Sulfurimonadaceae bacterium]
MEIVLRDNLINVKTDFATLNKAWMKDFLIKHSRSMLYLEKAVLIFRNDILKEAREEFLDSLSDHHATKQNLSKEFFHRSLLRFEAQPIRIELNQDELVEEVDVNLYAYDSDTVLISLDYPNPWVMSYLRSQLEVYIQRGSDMSMVLDVGDERAKARLDRTLNKKDVLHYKLKYNFNERFLSKLYNKYTKYSFFDIYEDEADDYASFYAILECPIGSDAKKLKDNYRRLAKAYHPDIVAQDTPHLVAHYTQKFQLLQEAYSVLRDVS